MLYAWLILVIKVGTSVGSGISGPAFPPPEPVEREREGNKLEEVEEEGVEADVEVDDWSEPLPRLLKVVQPGLLLEGILVKPGGGDEDKGAESEEDDDEVDEDEGAEVFGLVLLRVEGAG